MVFTGDKRQAHRRQSIHVVEQTVRHRDDRPNGHSDLRPRRSPDAWIAQAYAFRTASTERVDTRVAGRRLLPSVAPLKITFLGCALAPALWADVQEAASHADPRTTMRYDGLGSLSTGTPPTSSLPSWPAPPGD